MAEVYIVTAGDYSDYGIVAVFSTREKADAFLAVYNKDRRGYTGNAEVWELDRTVEEVVRAWRVTIDREGNVVSASDDSNPDAEAYHYGLSGAEEFIGYGKTHEHARRSAENLRREVLAFAPGTTPDTY